MPDTDSVEQVERVEVLVAYVCSDCGEQIHHDPEWDSRTSEYVRGHYHDPPEGWEGEDPWFDAVEIEVISLSTLHRLASEIENRIESLELSALSFDHRGEFRAADCDRAEAEGLREAARLIRQAIPQQDPASGGSE